ncbi:hypothetical protein [Nonomuraea gerenzanensis]|uniref:Putative secreted protein n=1 Tax=Nonomuraea gerenzanensis TaxID=93944 RepID=A0A1M4ECP1_9ACTN|nr:hypothetical protein [Nonomuraea gerenzanensis]UBU08354.1 hypothetical protein LCN96_28575 [Nonomuraea gerenzanensis]SBO96695.1 putative secreted protein [Nonomuraea gerenzanensis]
MPFVDQLPALLGVVVGAVGSYAASSLTERGRWRRARTERWDSERFHSYARYAHLLKIQIHLAQRIGAARGLPRTGNPMDIEEGLAQLDEAETNRAAEWESAVSRARDAFYAGARRDLGIAGPPPPSGQWPQPWEIDEAADPGAEIGAQRRPEGPAVPPVPAWIMTEPPDIFQRDVLPAQPPTAGRARSLADDSPDDTP